MHFLNYSLIWIKHSIVWICINVLLLKSHPMSCVVMLPKSILNNADNNTWNTNNTDGVIELFSYIEINHVTNQYILVGPHTHPAFVFLLYQNNSRSV